MANTLLIFIAIFQAFQTMLLAMGAYILRDMRDRVSRLETIEMNRVKYLEVVKHHEQ